ncbi:MAG: hypothetical protein NC213_09320 [Acetobacter sp.]|nr:hypothetical protein [Bacteroides sp.]MCM1341930.1 hypothetical protein [Acetobacter sp.]MCM1434114.1 hypothetical protein [Clostridiales bacterium]
MKKILALLFSLIIVMTFPFEAFAAEENKKEQKIQKIISVYGDVYDVKAQYIDGWIVAKAKDCENLYYSNGIVDNDLVIFSNYDVEEKDLKIPSKIGGYNVAVLAGFDANTAKSLYIPKNIKLIGTFDLVCGNGVEDLEGSSFSVLYGYSLEKITVSKDNKYYSSKSGVLYNKKGTELLFYPVAKKGKKFTIPETVKKVDSMAFGGHSFKYLRTLVVTPNVKNFNISKIEQNSYDNSDIISKIYFKNLKINTNTINLSQWENPLSDNTTVYCFKNSDVHKYFKKIGHKNIKFISKPKAPKKATVKSAKWKNGVKLSIKKQDCSYFRVYRYNSKTKKYDYLGYTKSNSFTDKTAKKGKTYKYKVSAVNKKNCLKKAGSKSAVFTVKTKTLR